MRNLEIVRAFDVPDFAFKVEAPKPIIEEVAATISEEIRAKQEDIIVVPLYHFGQVITEQYGETADKKGFLASFEESGGLIIEHEGYFFAIEVS